MGEPCFDLWHEDGLLFEEQPQLFVLLDRSPIVWTVRGLRYFRPRLALLGTTIRDIRTREEFESAFSRWLRVEWQLLEARIHRRSREGSSPHALLSEILKGDS